MSEDEKKIKARENAKRYYQKHREKILARQKEYVRKRYHTDEEFRKRTLENHKRYENNNLERVKKIKRNSQKKYYQQHIDYYRNYNKQWSKEKYDSLKKEIERLNKELEFERQIKKEVREYIEKNKVMTQGHFDGKQWIYQYYELICEPKELLEILDKVDENK